MKKKHDQNTYLHGTHNAICHVCGFKFKAIDLRERWDGLLVCMDDYEERHPLEFGREIVEENRVERPSPDPTPKYRDVNYLDE